MNDLIDRQPCESIPDVGNEVTEVVERQMIIHTNWGKEHGCPCELCKPPVPLQPEKPATTHTTARQTQDEDEGEGRSLTPAFGEGEIDPADIPF